MVNLTISRVSNGADIKDHLINDQKGINHGEVTNNVESLEEIYYIRHDGLSPITDLKIYVEGLAELITWADTTSGDGLLLDANNDQTFEYNFKSGFGTSLATAAVLGTINAAEEKIIRMKIKVPEGEDNPGVRNFDLKFNYDYTT